MTALGMAIVAAIMLGVGIPGVMTVDRRITRHQYTPLWIECAVLTLASFGVVALIGAVAAAVVGAW